MLMTNDDVKTPRDTGLRIKTEVKAPSEKTAMKSRSSEVTMTSGRCASMAAIAAAALPAVRTFATRDR